MHLVTINKRKFSVPGSWDEMSLDDLYQLYRVITKPGPVQGVKTKMIIHSLKMTVGRWKTGSVGLIRGVWNLIPAESIAALSSCFDFLFCDADDSGACKLDIRLSLNPLAYIIKDVDPGHALLNVSFGQYQYLCHFLSLHDSNPEESMKGIFYTIYDRNFVKNGVIDENFKIPGGYPEEFLFTAAVWYVMGSVKILAESFPKVFSGGSDESGDDVFRSQLRLLDNLTDGDVTKREAVRNSTLWDVMHNIEMRIDKYEEQKRMQS